MRQTSHQGGDRWLLMAPASRRMISRHWKDQGDKRAGDRAADRPSSRALTGCSKGTEKHQNDQADWAAFGIPSIVLAQVLPLNGIKVAGMRSMQSNIEACTFTVSTADATRR